MTALLPRLPKRRMWIMATKVIMPQSALDTLFLEFTSDEGFVCFPQWMMDNLHLEERDRVVMKTANLRKGTYVKLQPHTMDFIEISNPKAVLEKALRSYSCLTTGDTIMISFNNKKYLINVVETRPSAAVSIVETDCEVDFAPPLDYKEPEPVRPSPPPRVGEVQPEGTEVIPFRPFTGVRRRLNGKPIVSSSPAVVEPDPLPREEPNAASSSNVSRHQAGRSLVFDASRARQSSSRPNMVGETNSEEPSSAAEPPKFQPFTGKEEIYTER
ncbi:hypothetical protein Drorol1_Dr00019109 [Drosera rotundifolia]